MASFFFLTYSGTVTLTVHLGMLSHTIIIIIII